METVFKLDRIIDRNDYVCNISNHINECILQKRRSVFFLYGETGIGKSSIIQKLCIKRNNEPYIVVVKTPPSNQDSTPMQGQYLSYIANALNVFFSETIWSLDYFLENSLSEYSNHVEMETLLNSAHSISSAIIAVIGKSILKSSLTADKILLSNDIDSIIVLKEYIISIMSSKSIILDVTNAQNMDSMTATVLKDIFDDSNNKILFFEYTIKDDSDLSMYTLIDMFNSTDILMVTERVKPLPFEYALTLYNNDDLSLNEMENFYRDVIKGNLYLLYKMNSISENIMHVTNPLINIIEKLSYGAKLILAIVCLHNGYMSMLEMNRIINGFSDEYYIKPTVFEELTCVLSFNMETITLDHASVIDSFGVNIDNYAITSACKFLISYYKKDNNIPITSSSHNKLLCLLRCYSIVSPENVISLLTEFKNAVLDTFSENNAFEIIEKAYNALAPNCDINLNLHITYFCYSLGLYNGAFNLLNRISPPFSKGYYALNCILLNRIDKHDMTIESCDELLRISMPDSRFSLVIKMIKMLSERSLNQQNFIKTFKNIIKNKAYKDYLEFGFVLRNSQIVYSYNESLSYIEESITFFENRNQPLYAAYSKLTLAVQKARLGRLNESQDIIKSIKPSFEASTFEKHILLNNEIAISILKHDADQNTLLLIEQSLLTVTTVFDRLVLLNNNLSYFIINKIKGILVESLIDKIYQLSEQEPDMRHRRRLYTNIYLYYKHVLMNEEKANYWKQIALSYNITEDKLTDTFLGLIKPDNEFLFLTSKNCYVLFITMWHFEFSFYDL